MDRRPQTPEEEQPIPAFEVTVTPGGSMTIGTDAVLLQRVAAGRLGPWRPTSTPVLASPSSSSAGDEPPWKKPRSQKSLFSGESSSRGRPLLEREVERLINMEDSGSEVDEDEAGDDLEDSAFNMADFNDDEINDIDTSHVQNMRAVAQTLRDHIIEEEEQRNLGRDEVFTWSDDFSEFSGQEAEYIRSPGPSQISLDHTELFELFWPASVVSTIVQETNRYAQEIIEQSAEHRAPSNLLMSWVETTVDEIYRLFALMILMSFCNRSRVKDYWTTGVLEMPKFRGIMSRDRYLLLIRFLHFVDNDNIPTNVRSYDRKIAKIRPILDHCNSVFPLLYTPGKYLSLDESLLLWKGRLSWVQCIRSKAARFGIKSFELCEALTGYNLKIILYGGKDSSFVQGPIHGFENPTAKVVLELMDGYLDVGHTLVMDNWYNQLPLTRFLKSKNTDVIGTMNRNRLNVPIAIKNLTDRGLARGHVVSRNCGDITMIAWKDVKIVTVISTCHGNDMAPSRRAGEAIMKPLAISQYNKYMGGVDLKDQKLSMFFMERKRGSKWYHKVFRRLLNTSLLNAYIIYLKNPTYRLDSHREFRAKVAAGLLNKFGVERQVVERPSASVRLDRSRDHYPIQERNPESHKETYKRGQCVRCTKRGKRQRVTFQCTACKVFLCLGDCWKDYHSLENL